MAFLQWLTLRMERLTRMTANTWDDGLVAKPATGLAFAGEILAALGAFDPQLGKRIQAVRGERKTV